MTRLLLALALLLPATAASAQIDALVVPNDSPDWLTMEDAIAKSKADSTLILVYGFASWCTFCARFDANVFTDDDVQDYIAANYSPTRLNLEDTTAVQFFDARVTGVQLGRAMGIAGTPTNVFVDVDGSLITKLPGYTDPETFLYTLQYVREAAYETMPFDAFLEQRRSGLRLEPQVGDLLAPPQGGQ